MVIELMSLTMGFACLGEYVFDFAVVVFGVRIGLVLHCLSYNRSPAQRSESFERKH